MIYSAMNIRPFLRWSLLSLLCIMLLGFGSFSQLLSPEKEPWPRWRDHDPDSKVTLDHSGWSDLLKRFLRLDADGLARFDYAALKRDASGQLDAYLAQLGTTRVSRLSRPEQLAYWINLYNALTVRLVADAYPVKSIRDIDISPGLFADGPWGKVLIEVEGQGITLNDIEHRILRPLWDDPRLHYAVNCASVGCPNLAAEAYTAANTEHLLEAGAAAYVNSPRGVRWDGDSLVVSSIYAWFLEDFGGSQQGVLQHVRRYAHPPLVDHLEGVREIQDHGYDWRLNAAL